ncbi:MAG: cadherin-like beta sandwich domain-containing protein [Acutalibacteraceae bacterium]
MKRIFAILCVLMLAITICSPAAFAASAKATISLSSSSVTKGGTVKVTVKYTANELIGSWNFLLKYDKNYLEYKGGGDDNSGGGVVRFVDSRDKGSKTVMQTVTFKALKVGSCYVSTDTLEIVREDGFVNIGSTEASAKITINAPKEASTNANLSSLKISPGTLTPAFSSSVTEYTAKVDYSVKKLVVSAATAHSGATKSLSSTDLVVGENKIKVTVTAESGAKKTYTITVKRAASPLADLTVTLGAITYKVVFEEDQIKPPAKDFTPTSVLYKGNTLPALSSPKNLFKLVCLLSPSNEKCWFMYDETSEAFTKYISIVPPNKNYIILDMPQTETAPEGYILKSVAVNDKDFVYAFVRTDNETDKIIIVYAMTLDGKKELYLYDTQEKTFMRYNISSDSQSEEVPVGLSDSYEVLSSKLIKAEKDLKLSQIFIIIAAALFSILLVLGIVYIIKDRRARKGEGQV